MEDKYFYIVKATNTKGKFIKEIEGGKNFWLSEKEILTKEKVFEDILKILKGVKTGKFFFLEKKYNYSAKQY